MSRAGSVLISAALAASIAALAGCGDDLSRSEKETIVSLSLAKLPDVPPSRSNRAADDPRAAALGEKLFHDTGLSGPGTVACATCHDPARGFQDGLPRGVAVGTTDKRTMPLAGVAWNIWFFWDGRRDSLWGQALEPLENPREHAATRSGIVRHVVQNYPDDYEAVFGHVRSLADVPDAASPLGDESAKAAWQEMSEDKRFAVDLAFANVGKAIAAFERTLRPEETRFDRFAAAIARDEKPQGEAAFSELEREGLRLFIGSGNCLECHNGPRFTDDHFHNTGVPDAEGATAGQGRAEAIDKLLADPFSCTGPFSDTTPDECDELRFMLRESPELVRAFKTPSLRGVGSRAPYMHAGQFATLEEVVDHYASAPRSPDGESELRPVRLTERGRQALVAFLETL